MFKWNTKVEEFKPTSPPCFSVDIVSCINSIKKINWDTRKAEFIPQTNSNKELLDEIEYEDAYYNSLENIWWEKNQHIFQDL